MHDDGEVVAVMVKSAKAVAVLPGSFAIENLAVSGSSSSRSCSDSRSGGFGSRSGG